MCFNVFCERASVAAATWVDMPAETRSIVRPKRKTPAGQLVSLLRLL